MIYIIIFIFSIFMSYLAQREKTNKYLAFAFSVLSVLGLIIIAGYRDINIGTDTHAYPVSTLENGGNYVFLLLSGIEPLYGFLGFLVSSLGGKIEHMLLLTHAIILICFYIAFWKLKKRVPLWLSMFFFCFLFYNISLNFSRQMLACGVVYLGFFFISIVR